LKINWKVRLRNPAWITSLLALIVSTVYQLLAMFDVAPALTEDALMQAVAAAVQLLTLMGVLIDPTTKGLSDSARALEYERPE